MKLEGIAGAVLGLAALGVALYSHHKTEVALNKMGVSFDELKNKCAVTVSEDVTNAALKNKVDEVVSQEVEKASRKLLDDAKTLMQGELHKEALNAVREASEANREAAKQAYLEGVKKDAERTYVQATTNASGPDYSRAFDGMTGYQKMEAFKAFANAIGGIAKPNGF